MFTYDWPTGALDGKFWGSWEPNASSDHILALCLMPGQMREAHTGQVCLLHLPPLVWSLDPSFQLKVSAGWGVGVTERWGRWEVKGWRDGSEDKWRDGGMGGAPKLHIALRSNTGTQTKSVLARCHPDSG